MPEVRLQYRNTSITPQEISMLTYELGGVCVSLFPRNEGSWRIKDFRFIATATSGENRQAEDLVITVILPRDGDYTDEQSKRLATYCSSFLNTSHNIQFHGGRRRTVSVSLLPVEASWISVE